MIVITQNGYVGITVTDTPESFAYVPKAMVRVLQLAMESGMTDDKGTKNAIITYLDFLEQILPESYTGLDLEIMQVAQNTITNVPQAATGAKATA